MNELLKDLLNALDLVAQSNQEIYDTECRERMGDPIFHQFLRPTPDYRFPTDFGLYDEDANRRVGEALHDFATRAVQRAEQEGIATFHDRLAAFQNAQVCSDHEGNYYDEFFGWLSPKDFDESGNALPRPSSDDA